MVFVASVLLRAFITTFTGHLLLSPHGDETVGFFLTAGSNDKLKDVLVLPFEVPFQGLAVVQSYADDQGETGAGFDADTALLADGIIKRVALIWLSAA